jgi:hypothetical protein
MARTSAGPSPLPFVAGAISALFVLGGVGYWMLQEFESGDRKSASDDDDSDEDDAEAKRDESRRSGTRRGGILRQGGAEFADPDTGDFVLDLPLIHPGEYSVTVFTEWQDELEDAAGELRDRGYEVHFNSGPNSDLNIKYGAASDAILDEVLEAFSDETGLSESDFRRSHQFSATDNSIFVNLGQTPALAVLARQVDVAIMKQGGWDTSALSTELMGAGYDVSVVADRARTAGIYFGSSFEGLAVDLQSEVSDHVFGLPMTLPLIKVSDSELRSRYSRADFTIVLPTGLEGAPAASGTPSRAQRARHSVYIYTDRAADMGPLVSALRGLGYSVSLTSPPDAVPAILYGGASSGVLQEIVEQASRHTRYSVSDFRREGDWDRSDMDIWLEIP